MQGAPCMRRAESSAVINEQRTNDSSVVRVISAAVTRRLAQVKLAHRAVLAARHEVVCRTHARSAEPLLEEARHSAAVTHVHTGAHAHPCATKTGLRLPNHRLRATSRQSQCTLGPSTTVSCTTRLDQGRTSVQNLERAHTPLERVWPLAIALQVRNTHLRACRSDCDCICRAQKAHLPQPELPMTHMASMTAAGQSVKGTA